jgi:hypothetical protein
VTSTEQRDAAIGADATLVAFGERSERPEAREGTRGVLRYVERSRPTHRGAQQLYGRDTAHPQFSGGDIEEAIPDPIPNSEVKLLGADGTARAT